MKENLAKRAAAEFVGTAFLLAAIVGSGIMAERLAGGNAAVALLANTAAIAAMLVALIAAFAPISGAHFNPAVTLADVLQKGLSWRDALVYGAAQTCGAFTGVGSANLMFELPIFFQAQKERIGAALIFSEFVATFGLLAIIFACARRRSANVVPFAVAAYVVAAIWFTSSTGFANPAVTLARTMSDTFTGIRIEDAPAFVAAQLFGAVAATLFFRWLVPPNNANETELLTAHQD